MYEFVEYWGGEVIVGVVVIYGLWVVVIDIDVGNEVGCEVYKLGIFFIVCCIGFVGDVVVEFDLIGSCVVLDYVLYY